MNPIRSLLTAIVDYAGLFPPSGLEMSEAVSKTAIRIPLPALDESQISQLKSLLAKHSGTCPLEFELLEQQCRIRVSPEEDLSVDPIPSFVEAVENLFGENSVALYTGK